MNQIGVIGVGKLGLCFALNAERKGYSIIGIDKNQVYIDAINNKTLQSSEPFVEQYLQESVNFESSIKINKLMDDAINLIFIFVATPSLPDGSYDHSQIEKVTDELIQLGKRANETHLIIGCTTMPGYCTILANKMLEYNYTVSYNPEFIAQGSIVKNQLNPDQILIGEANENAGNMIQAVFEKIVENKPKYIKMDSLSAEIAKIATNCFLTTKISFANSIGDLAIKAGADADKILEAIGADSRIGHKYLNYGFGFGGPCFPRDNRALGKYANKINYPLLISEATDMVNKKHLEFQFENYLTTYSENEIIVFDGITYKKGTPLLDESQQLALAIKLTKAGRKVLIKENLEVIEQLNLLYPKQFIFEII